MLLLSKLIPFPRSDDYKNLYHLVTHEERRDWVDVTTKYIFAAILLSCLKAIGYFDALKREVKEKPSDEKLLIGKKHTEMIISYLLKTL